MCRAKAVMAPTRKSHAPAVARHLSREWSQSPSRSNTLSNAIEEFNQRSDRELVAAVLGGEFAHQEADTLLFTCGGLRGLRRALGRWVTQALGISEQGWLRLAASIELSRRVMAAEAMAEASILANPEAVARWARATLGELQHEEIWLAALDVKHRVVGVRKVAQGGLAGCSCTARDILRHALQLGAVSFVLIHNHPSGDPMPSIEDARMTVEVARAANLVGTPLLDHVVVGLAQHCSLLELGLLDGLEAEPKTINPRKVKSASS